MIYFHLNHFSNLIVKTDLDKEKNRIARAIDATKNHSRIQKVIDFAMFLSVLFRFFFCFFNFANQNIFHHFNLI